MGHGPSMIVIVDSTSAREGQGIPGFSSREGRGGGEAGTGGLKRGSFLLAAAQANLHYLLKFVYRGRIFRTTENDKHWILPGLRQMPGIMFGTGARPTGGMHLCHYTARDGTARGRMETVPLG